MLEKTFAVLLQYAWIVTKDPGSMHMGGHLQPDGLGAAVGKRTALRQARKLGSPQGGEVPGKDVHAGRFLAAHAGRHRPYFDAGQAYCLGKVDLQRGAIFCGVLRAAFKELAMHVCM